MGASKRDTDDVDARAKRLPTTTREKKQKVEFVERIASPLTPW
jgi:hypothetical protein